MNKNYIDDNELLVDKFDNSVKIEEEKLKFRKPKHIFRKRRNLIVLISILSAIAIAATAVTCAIIFKPVEPYDDSAAFYFSGVGVSEEGSKMVVYDKIEITVRNYADSLRISKEPVENFTVKVSCDGNDITKKAKLTLGDTSLVPEMRSETKVTVTLPQEYYNVPIDVTVTSSPLVKELKGTFIIRPTWSYSVEDGEGNSTAYLNVSAEKDVTLEFEWDAALINPDRTDAFVKTAEAGESKCSINLSAGMTVTIPLFKTPELQELLTEESECIKLREIKTVVVEESQQEDAEAETEEITEAEEAA